MPFGLGKKDKSSKADPNSANAYATKAIRDDPYANQNPPSSYASSASTYVTKFKDDQYATQNRAPSYASSATSLDAASSDKGGKSAAPRYQSSGSSYDKQGGYGGGVYDSNRANTLDADLAGAGSQFADYDSKRPNNRDTMATDAGRAALFGDAASRQQQPSASSRSDQPPSYSANDPGRAALFGEAPQRYAANPYGASQPSSFGGFDENQDRELTEEEKMEQDVQRTKNEIRNIKRSDVDSMRNAVRIARETLDQGSKTIEKLNEQGEMFQNTSHNLDCADLASDAARDRTAELKRANRSMFAPGFKAPFSSKTTRHEKEIEARLEHHKLERDIADNHLQRQQQSTRQATVTQRAMNEAARAAAKRKGNPDRAKFQFEADSEDEQMEDDIQENVDELAVLATQLKGQASVMNNTLKQHNQQLDKIMGKVDGVDNKIYLNTERLKGIK